ncbi:Predicted E3 ubiquitin ligase [Phaffia rhodozyma]|uniref:Predicted E3 ubiquitin ligase n=1 Tax=Phaffia rhodozyma TaxID=264483 RepID=A0A0F7SJP4_PHARH|nr:Predicted E3 ubiquitin ligase [Phaffia rhodozyma]
MSTSAQRPSYSYSGWGASNTLTRTLARRSPFATRTIPLAALQAQAQAHAAGAAAANHNGNAVDNAQQQRQQTLFGPIIGGEDDMDDNGLFDDKPQAGGRVRESVGVDVVKGWVDKSKTEQAPHPTTTLQSLVNLKRPTLLLQPLQSSLPVDSSSPHALHLIKFTYDASTSTTLITLTLYTPTPTQANPLNVVQQIVHHSTHPGGFGRLFELTEAEAIDLATAKLMADEAWGKYERHIENLEAARQKNIVDNEGKGSVQATGESRAAAAGHARSGSRFNIFGRGSRGSAERDVEAQVDVPMASLNLNKTDGEEIQKITRRDMRIVVRLEARGERGEPLPSLNAQRTHVELMLQSEAQTTDRVPSAEEPVVEFTQNEGEVDLTSVPLGLEETSGSRGGHWSAKVVKREALIGSHTFHLREIFGLTSSSASSNDPVAPSNALSSNQSAEDSTLNDCIVCLVSPKDVVLLPCRHLVVCKECAVGMVEFGAGGKVMRREEAADGLTGTGEGTAGEGTGAGQGAEGTTEGQAQETVLTPAQERRRKKKVKGWFCPVCRQPYTSLLRIALPSTKPGLQQTVDGHIHASHVDHADPIPRAPSPVPTLPGRAASVLYPAEDEQRFFANDDDEEEEESEGQRREREQHEANLLEAQRPTFVLGDELEDENERTRRAAWGSV